MDGLLTTKNASPNDILTRKLQDESIVAPETDPLSNNRTVLLNCLGNHGFCECLIEESACTANARRLLKASYQLGIGLANMPVESMTS